MRTGAAHVKEDKKKTTQARVSEAHALAISDKPARLHQFNRFNSARGYVVLVGRAQTGLALQLSLVRSATLADLDA